MFGQDRMSFDYKAEGQGRCGLVIHLTASLIKFFESSSLTLPERKYLQSLPGTITFFV